MGTGEEKRKLLLYRLTTIIKALFPHHHTKPPDQLEQIEAIKFINPEDEILLKDLVRGITLLNGFSRMNNQNQYISTRTDLINALQLTLPKELQLTPKHLEVHHQLSAIFKDQPFDYVSAGSRLKASKSTLKRHFNTLLVHGLITIENTKESKRTYFQIIPTAAKDTSQDTFETMQGEWKDFVGWVDF